MIGEGRMRRYMYFLLVLMVAVAIGCGKIEKEGAEQPAHVAPETAAQPAPPPAAPQTEVQPVSPQPVQEVARPAASATTAKPAKRVEKAAAPPRVEKKAPVAVSTPPVETPQAAAEPVREIPTPAAPETPQPAVPKVIPEVPKVPEPKFATIPRGSSIFVRLQQALDSGVNKAGDSFRAVLDRDIEVDGIVVAPRGCVLNGQVAQVERAGRVKGKASMTLQLDHLIIENQSYPLQTESLSFEGQSSIKKDAKKVGVGAGIGALIGAIAGGGKGAAIGSAVGAGAGGAAVVATRGDELNFEAEHKFTFVLQNDVRIRVQ
jgi:hypothetical protein